MAALAVGGTADHVHLLLSLPPTLALGRSARRWKCSCGGMDWHTTRVCWSEILPSLRDSDLNGAVPSAKALGYYRKLRIV